MVNMALPITRFAEEICVNLTRIMLVLILLVIVLFLILDITHFGASPAP